jgi:hypothetical protein
VHTLVSGYYVDSWQLLLVIVTVTPGFALCCERIGHELYLRNMVAIWLVFFMDKENKLPCLCVIIDVQLCKMNGSPIFQSYYVFLGVLLALLRSLLSDPPLIQLSKLS